MQSRLRKQFNVTEYGDGPVTLFFIHGLGTSQAIWRLVAPTFASRYRIVLMDLMGCGGSDFPAWDPQRYATLEGHAADVAEVAEHLSSQNTVLVLHSVAAMIGLLADLRAPHVFDAHAMITPSPCYQDLPGYRGGFPPHAMLGMLQTLDSDLPAWTRGMARAAAGERHQSTVAPELERLLGACHPPALRQFARLALTSDFRHRLRELVKPTLVLQCEEDAIAPPEVGRYMAQQLPDGRLALLAEQGHLPQLSSPWATSAALSAFLDGLGLAGR